MYHRTKWRRISVLVLAVLVAGLLAACGTQPAAPASQPAQPSPQPAQQTAATGPAEKPEVVTLKLAAAFNKGNSQNDALEQYLLKEVESRAGDYFKIQWVGGPETFPPFELIEAVRSGAVDLAHITTAFYTAQAPAVDGMKLADGTPAELRAKGVTDWLNGILNRMGVQYLGRMVSGMRFAIYTTQPIEGANFKGMVMRTTPVYKAMLEALNAQTVTTPPGEVYTALERGVVQGYGWPEVGIFDLGWHEKTKYIIQPSIYQVEVSLLMNKRKWDGLSEAHKKVLMDLVLETEQWGYDHFKDRVAAEFERMKQAGIQVIDLQGAERDKWVKTARSAAWAALEAQAAEDTRKLRALLGE